MHYGQSAILVDKSIIRIPLRHANQRNFAITKNKEYALCEIE
jgi:hypothetical protein